MIEVAIIAEAILIENCDWLDGCWRPMSRTMTSSIITDRRINQKSRLRPVKGAPGI